MPKRDFVSVDAMAVVRAFACVRIPQLPMHLL